MTRITSLKLVCLFSGVILAGGFTSSLRSIEAQCVGQCVGLTAQAPMWQIYGINPFQPRTTSPQPFSPLQNTYAAPMQRCPATTQCDNDMQFTTEEIYVGEVSGLSVPIDDNTLVVDRANPNPIGEMPITGSEVLPSETQPGLPVVVETEPKAPAANKEPAAISSPSDIILSPPNSEEPTPAPAAPGNQNSELDGSRQEIEVLKKELGGLRAKARAAGERAYAAEQAAKAANQRAEKRLKERDQAESANSRMEKDVKAEVALHQQRLEATQKELADAQKELEKQKLAASKSANSNQAIPKPKSPDRVEKANKNSPEIQIKKLNQAMKTQIKKSGEQIRSKSKRRIDGMIRTGKAKDDPEFATIRKEAELEAKESEEKIRKRTERRIEKIRKDSAAKSKD